MQRTAMRDAARCVFQRRKTAKPRQGIIRGKTYGQGDGSRAPWAFSQKEVSDGKYRGKSCQNILCTSCYANKNGDCKSQDNYPDTQDQSTHAYPGIAPSSKKPFPILFCFSKETSGTRYTKGSDLRQSLRCKFSQTALMEDGKGWADSFCTPPSCLSPWRVSTWAWIQ